MTEHRDAIALLDAMIQQALEGYEEGGTPKLWRELSRTWWRAEAARGARDKTKWREAYAKLGLLIEWGGSQADREAELLTLLERRRKLVDSETRRKLAKAKTFTHEEVAAFYTGLGAAVRRHVLDPTKTDEEKLVAIDNDMAAMGERRGIGASGGGRT